MRQQQDFEQEAGVSAKRKEFREAAIQLGQVSGSIAGEQDRSAAAVFNRHANTQQADQDKQRRRETDTLLWLSLIRAEITAIDAAQAALSRQLQDKYGSDFIHGMAEAFIAPDALADLSTPEQMLQALADRMLDANGQIKPEYANSPEAQYIFNWNRKRLLEASLNGIEAGRPVTAEQAEAVRAAAEAAGVGANLPTDLLLIDDRLQEAADAGLDAAADRKATTDLGKLFGG